MGEAFTHRGVKSIKLDKPELIAIAAGTSTVVSDGQTYLERHWLWESDTVILCPNSCNALRVGY